MKNLIEKNQILNSIIFLYLIVFTSNTIFSQTQYIRNGSFENHFLNTYPLEISSSYQPNVPKGPGYPDNQLVKCIGFCVNRNLWEPSAYDRGRCDDNV